MLIRISEFGALIFVGLCLIPAGAHFFEMWGKLQLGKDAYFAIQPIYNGWALFGITLVAAILATSILTWLTRDTGASAWLSGFSAALLVASLVVFFIRIYPMNVATKNWTAVPDDWESVRQQWESGHAISAVITFTAFLCICAAVVVRG
jgi:hypothetical protein